MPEKSVAILGAGYISDWHMKALRANRIPVGAVCDVLRSRAQAFADRWRIPQVYDSLSKMLAEARPDSVHVLLPPDFHAAAAKEILTAGTRVLLEKPACVSVAECEELQKFDPSQLGVSHNFLFSGVYERLRADVASGVLGTLREIEIVWNKELGQLTGGPFGGWMLRHPGNIMLEVGSHSVAHMLDLVGDVEVVAVETDWPLDLPNGVRFYRRWKITARRGNLNISLNFSLGGGFPEHRVHVRGLFGTATSNFEAGTYVRRTNVFLPEDFNRFRITRHEGSELRTQARKKLTRYLLAKLKLSSSGNDFGNSLTSSIACFYQQKEVDPRLSIGFATKVIATCSRIAEMGTLGKVLPVPLDSPPPRPNPDILVLGGTGFIGQALVKQLVDAGKSVRLLVRDPRYLPISLKSLPIEAIRGDLSSPATLDAALIGIQTVYHLARANVKTWKDYQDQEIGGTRNIAEAALKAGVREFIYTGTIDSYFAGESGSRIVDETPLDKEITSRNLYARAKAVSEELLLNMQREKGLPLVIFRPGIVIGSGGNPAHWGVGMWNGSSVCRIWGSGRNPLPLVLVQDVAAALVLALNRPELTGKVYNLVGDATLTGQEYLDEFEAAGKVKLNRGSRSIFRFWLSDMFKWCVKMVVRHPERRFPSYRDWNSRTQRAIFDCAGAKKDLGWKPVTDRAELIQQGIAVPVRQFIGEGS